MIKKDGGRKARELLKTFCGIQLTASRKQKIQKECEFWHYLHNWCSLRNASCVLTKCPLGKGKNK